MAINKTLRVRPKEESLDHDPSILPEDEAEMLRVTQEEWTIRRIGDGRTFVVPANSWQIIEKDEKLCHKCNVTRPIGEFRLRNKRELVIRETQCVYCEREYKKMAAQRWRDRQGIGKPSPAPKWDPPYDRIRSAISWGGGKATKVGQILPMFPRPDRIEIYVELFGGPASLLFALPPGRVEVINDIDGGLNNWYRVLRDEEDREKLIEMVMLTPYSRQQFYDSKRVIEEGKWENPVEWAYNWYVVARMSFAGVWGSGWGYSRTPAGSSGVATTNSSWMAAIPRLDEMGSRLSGVQIPGDPWQSAIKTWDTEDTLFFIDPPYKVDTKVHVHTLDTIEAHEELAEKMSAVRGAVVFTFYENDLFERVYRHLISEYGWDFITISDRVRMVGKTRVTGLLGHGAIKEESRYERTEMVLSNPRCQAMRDSDAGD